MAWWWDFFFILKTCIFLAFSLIHHNNFVFRPVLLLFAGSNPFIFPFLTAHLSLCRLLVLNPHATTLFPTACSCSCSWADQVSIFFFLLYPVTKTSLSRQRPHQTDYNSSVWIETWTGLDGAVLTSTYHPPHPILTPSSTLCPLSSIPRSHSPSTGANPSRTFLRSSSSFCRCCCLLLAPCLLSPLPFPFHLSSLSSSRRQKWIFFIGLPVI